MILIHWISSILVQGISIVFGIENYYLKEYCIIILLLSGIPGFIISQHFIHKFFERPIIFFTYFVIYFTLLILFIQFILGINPILW